MRRRGSTRVWAERPLLALLVRASYLLVPMGCAVTTSALLVRINALADLSMLVRWVVVFAAATVVLVVTHRTLARLLPLAALLQLSIEFPGPAPSRYAVARDAGNSAKLREIVARAQRGDPLVDLKDAEAARDILALVAALASHDAQTRGHSERVRVFTDLIADQLHLSAADRGQLRWAALLHDVGKLDVPGVVLNKTAKLDDDDWAALRSHPAAGARIVRPLDGWLGQWAPTIAQHHEKYDGTGYPLGLARDQICLGARIVAVADAFDVMTAARSYRKPIGRPAALRELTACSGTHFDPRVVRAMLAVSTPRLRIAMGPISWLGATPFLTASQSAAAAAQATAGVLVAGTLVAVGPNAAASPSATQPPAGGTPGTPSNHSAPRHSGSSGRGAAGGTGSPSPSASPMPSSSPSGSGKPSAPPGKPTASPTAKAGRPTPSLPPTPTPRPTRKPHGKPSTSPTPKAKASKHA